MDNDNASFPLNTRLLNALMDLFPDKRQKEYVEDYAGISSIGADYTFFKGTL